MSLRPIESARRALCLVVLMSLACVSLAGASATLLLEEPYGHMGFFTATGHAAVYLSGVCAESPVLLRPCAPGETGVVLSRYDAVGGYDWLAIPLIPYLYAVERPEDMPLFADAKLVAFLRDRYRRKYLENIVPDTADGGTPGGNWYQLIGSSYDRTMYGFEIETTPAQDAALIQKYNSSPNRSHFHLASSNCADFAKDVINFYYPRALHRSLIADVGITTPKQIAKMLVKFDAHHPELHSSRIVISQVPGSMPRSSTPHGVVESFLKSKKYIVPSAIASPIFAGCVFAVFVATGADRFEPDRDALVFEPDGDREPAMAKRDRRTYQKQLKNFLAETAPASSGQSVDKAWEKLQSKARAEFDDQSGPILRMQVAERSVEVGASAGNVLSSNAPPEVVQRIIEARIESELRHAPAHGLSQMDLARDWNLLRDAVRQQATMAESSLLSARSVSTGESLTGNGP